VVETKNAYRLEVAVSGLTKEDIEINVDGGDLRVSAQRAQRDEVQDGKYTRRAFNYTSFSRSFKLPETVNADDTAAQYKGSVFNITLPKKERTAAKVAGKIEIK